jgi:hypothetical protein
MYFLPGPISFPMKMLPDMIRIIVLFSLLILMLSPSLNAKNGEDSLATSKTEGLEQMPALKKLEYHNDSLSKEDSQVTDASLVIIRKVQRSINTHRPGVYIGPGVVGSRTFQVEAGFGFNRQRYFNVLWVSEMQIPALELRFGILPNTEISLNTALFTSEYPNSTGNMPPTIAIKTLLCKPQGLRPAIALRTGITLPGLVTTDYLDINRPAFSMIFVGKWKAGLKNAIFLNTGVQQNGYSSQLILPFAVAYERQLSENLTSYGEVAFTFFNPSGVTMRTDAGLYLALSPNLQVDFSTGIDLSGGLQGWFAEAGFSAKIPQKGRR